MPYMAKVKKTFRLSPEAAVKVESADNETQFIEDAILQYSKEKVIPEEIETKIPEAAKIIWSKER